MIYQYKNLITGAVVELTERLTEDEMKAQSLKRVYSVGFQIKSNDWGH